MNTYIFIHTGGWFSSIYLLSIATIYWLTSGIIATRFKTKEWRLKHAKNMLSAYAGILIAGNVLAGRIISAIFACIVIPILIKYRKTL